MFNLKSAFFGLCSAFLMAFLSYAAEIGLDSVSLNNTPHILHNTTIGLKPVQPSYKIARLQYLPELTDSENGWASNIIGGTYNKNDCSSYPLKSCPTGAKCSKCPFAKKYKINSCASPFTLSEGACVCPAAVALVYPNDVCTAYCSPRAGTARRCIAKSCTPSPDQTGCTRGTQACDDGCGKNTAKCCIACADTVTTKPANSSYVYSSCIDGEGTKNIQTGWACDSGYHKVNETCVKDCNVTNCAGYTLTSCPAGKICDSCTKTASNCSTDGTYYKVAGCTNNQKDTDTFWCSVPVSIDCSTLGYKRSSGSCGSMTQLACPFDTSKVACIDFN